MYIDIPKEELGRYLHALQHDLIKGVIATVDAKVVETGPGEMRLYVTYRFTEAPE